MLWGVGGRLAVVIATRLRGKHKPEFTPHLDTGDHVVVVNAADVVLTGKKLEQKKRYRHSGYPGGLRTIAYSDLMQAHPEQAVLMAVRGMLPHNSLGRRLFKRLKVCPGPDHPYQAQLFTQEGAQKRSAAKKAQAQEPAEQGPGPAPGEKKEA